MTSAFCWVEKMFGLLLAVMLSSMLSPSAQSGENPLLASWTGPHGGVPAFDEMELSALKPALEAGMAKALAEVDAIANDPEPRRSRTRSSPWSARPAIWTA